MAFFSKLTDSLGIGGTKVDAVLNNSTVRPGDYVEGIFKIKGGKVERVIDEVYINVYTKCEEEGDEDPIITSEIIQELRMPVNQTITPKETKEIPFRFKLYEGTPISTKKYPTWLDTSLDIKGAIDPSDKDYIKVAPHPYLERVFEGLELLGFQIKEIENEYVSSSNRPHPFKMIQEFEFKPKRGTIYKSALDELEVIAAPIENGIHIRFEIDRKARGLLSAFQELAGMDESKTSLFISREDLSQGPEHVAHIIKQKVDQYI